MHKNQEGGIRLEGLGSSIFSSLKDVGLGTLDDIVKEGKDYSKKQLEMIIGVIKKQLAHIFSSFIYVLVLAVFALCSIFFLMISLSLYLGELLGHNSLGFLATGGIFVIMTIIFYKWGYHRIESRIFTQLNKTTMSDLGLK